MTLSVRPRAPTVRSTKPNFRGRFSGLEGLEPPHADPCPECESLLTQFQGAAPVADQGAEVTCRLNHHGCSECTFVPS